MPYIGIIKDGRRKNIKVSPIVIRQQEIFDRHKRIRDGGYSPLIESSEMYWEIFATENALTDTYTQFIGKPPEESVKRTERGLFILVNLLVEEERNKILELIKTNQDVETYYQKIHDKYLKLI